MSIKNTRNSVIRSSTRPPRRPILACPTLITSSRPEYQSKQQRNASSAELSSLSFVGRCRARPRTTPPFRGAANSQQSRGYSHSYILILDHCATRPRRLNSRMTSHFPVFRSRCQFSGTNYQYRDPIHVDPISGRRALVTASPCQCEQIARAGLMVLILRKQVDNQQSHSSKTGAIHELIWHNSIRPWS